MIWPEWTRCQDDDVAWAFEAAIDDHKDADDAVKIAKAACRGCPVLNSCSQRGIELNAWGVWGGIWLRPARYRQTGECTRGHDITGPNGKRRSDGTMGCRRCNRARDLARKQKAPA